MLWGEAAWVRAHLYSSGLLAQRRLEGPVVSVGNLSMGGSGKTPVVALVARILRDEGCKVSILSRGYGGSFRGEALIVGDGQGVASEADLAGDEPVMLARSLPGVVVAVGGKRDLVGRVVESRWGPCIHILDDGFQHLRLARDLDLLCLDEVDITDLPFPAGRLRELPRAASRADLVLVTHLEGRSALSSLEERFGADRTFRVTMQPEGFWGLDGTSHAAPGRAFLLSGIAKPHYFEADVASSGPEVVGRRLFRDHHHFTPAEVHAAAAEARGLGADAIVTTAKDAVRIEATPTDPRILVFRVTAKVANEPRFRSHLMAAVGRRA